MLVHAASTYVTEPGTVNMSICYAGAIFEFVVEPEANGSYARLLMLGLLR